MLFDVFYCKRYGHLLAEYLITFSTWLSSRGHCMHSSWKHRTVSARHLRNFTGKKPFKLKETSFKLITYLLWCPLLPRVTWEIRIKSAIVIANCKHFPAMQQKLSNWSWSVLSSFKQEMSFLNQAVQWVTPDLAPTTQCCVMQQRCMMLLLIWLISKKIWQLLVSQLLPHPPKHLSSHSQA